MRKSISIGLDELKCWSSIKVFSLKGDHNVSENNLGYMIVNYELDFDIMVSKDSKEGKTIADLIAINSVEQINDYAETLFLSRLKPVELKELIKEISEKSFKDGEESMQEKFRKLMGIS